MEHPRDRPADWRGRTGLHREDGVEGLEVALIGVLIAIAIMVAIPTLGIGIGNALEGVAAAIQTAGDGIE